MHDHPLDRAAWTALTTRQAGLARGDELARRYHPQIAPFAAARDATPESLRALAALLPIDGPAILAEPEGFPTPAGIVVERTAAAVQMLCETLAEADADPQIQPLSAVDAPKMLALATLTAPGPFLSRTHEFGGFLGVKQDGVLIAMAGERMSLPGYTEVSGVCTHPEARGRGLARTLSHAVAAGILARGDQPFLHAYADNAAAIGLYESLGFRIRSAVTISVVRRAAD